MYLLLVLFIQLTSVLCEVKCPVHCDKHSHSDYVKKFCDRYSGTMEERCCIANGTKHFVIGLDVSSCEITTFSPKNVWRSGIKILDLQDNELHNVTKASFSGLSDLEYLYLPPDIECPGGPQAWNVVHNYTYHVMCETELNPCDYLNVSCTVNGQCIHQGPGAAKCVCLPNHYGYKCLQQGDFPTMAMVFGLSVPTVVISILSWLYLRKNVVCVEKGE